MWRVDGEKAMSNLKKLIQKFCPNGVEFRHLEDCCTILDKRRKPITKTARVLGKYPYYGANGIQDYVSDYIFDGIFVLVGEDGSVQTEKGNPIVNWAEGKIWVNNHAHIIEEIDGVILRYLYHYLQIVNVHGFIHGNIPKLNQSDFRSIKIAIPPIEVQREIVRILDNFTELTTEFTIKLTTELAMRKKQYEYYREKLLLLEKEHNIGCYNLCEIADIGTGSSNTNEGLNEGKYPFFVRSQEIKRKNDYEFDEIAIITAGDGVGVGKVLHYIEGKYALHQRAYRIHINSEKVLPKYFYHYMKGTFLRYIEKSAVNSSVTSIRKKMLDEYPVPVPTIEVQRKIVDILDNFDTICIDLNIGLPAEMEARKKQYEYYRDMLLTFVEDKNIVFNRAGG